VECFVVVATHGYAFGKLCTCGRDKLSFSKPRPSSLSQLPDPCCFVSLSLPNPALTPLNQHRCEQVHGWAAIMANASMRAAAAQYINPAPQLSHKTIVVRLYRKSLKTLNSW